MPRNIVICCDGTNNEVVGDQSNVFRLFRMLRQNAEQIVYYDAGVGTRVDPTTLWPLRRYLLKRFDGATIT